MLHHPSVNARMEQDKIRFPSIYKLNKYTIGMDRACVSIGNIGFIYISGYIDNDAGYTNSDIVNYITNNLQIKDLTLVGTEDECIHDEQGMGGI